MGNVCKKREKWSVIENMYLFPLSVVGKGPMISILNHVEGEIGES